ncbi:MAG: DUF2461 domain-containing protein [Rhodothermales bacterium]
MFDTSLPPFPGFRKEAFDFFRELARNNERDWFKARKTVYEDEVVWPLQCLVAEAGREAASQGFRLTADPKKSIFRIYRDTRFSTNKDPYKTHAGAVLTRDGTVKSSGGVYIHIEPDRPMMAAGFWHPENTVVRAWRDRMAQAPDTFLAMIDQLKAGDLELESDEQLKRMPAGYEAYADDEIAPYLRFKSYTVSRPFKEKELQSPDFTRTAVQMIKDCYPLLAYGWEG